MTITDSRTELTAETTPGVTTVTVPQTVPQTDDAPFRLTAVDLYKDIHKGIRAELFAATSTAGNIDPASRLDRAALADHIVSIGGVLQSHAHHEDVVIDPVLAEHLPDLAAEINDDHDRLETAFERVTDLARSVVDAPSSDRRRLVQLLHLDLARFTSDYLTHQDLEERVVMPRIEDIVGVEGCAAMHGAIVGSIPPDEMARSLAFMLPAMNVEDRVEMLGGIRLGAPPEVFAAVVDLARSVLTPTDFAALDNRLA